LDPRFGGVFRDAPHFQQFLLQLHRMRHRGTARFEKHCRTSRFCCFVRSRGSAPKATPS